MENWLPLGSGIALVIAAAINGYFALKGIKLKALLEEKLKPHRYNFEAGVKLSATVNESLLRLRLQMKADRATIMLFHNGGTYYTGEPMQKMTMSHEKVKTGIQNIRKDFAGVPASIYDYVLEKLLVDKYVTFPDVNDIEDDTFRNSAKYYGNKSIYFYNLYDMNEVWKGFLTLEYIHHPKSLSDMEFAVIKQTCYKIGGILVDWDKFIEK